MPSLSFFPSSVNLQIPQFQFRPRRSNNNFTITALSATTDTTILHHAAKLADSSAGHTSPHPNFACVITKKSDRNGGDDVIVGEGYLYAQGTKCAELQAVEMAGEMARGSTAYLNMEAGDCYGDFTPVSSLLQAGISRVVVGIRHPLQHLRGEAIRALRSEGVQVDVLGEELQSKIYEGALKYAMTFVFHSLC